MIVIQDGKGTGNNAEVDKNNDLHTRAITVGEVLNSTIRGEGYIVSTGTVNITNDTESYLLYIKNDSENDLVIAATVFINGLSTGGASDEVTFLGQINPTGGTIISSGLLFDPFNTNLGSANVFEGETRLALTLGLTATGGLQADGFIQGSGRHTFPNEFILPKGASLSGGAQCAAGNTSMNVSIGYTVYFRDSEII